MHIQLLLVSNLLASEAAAYCGVAGGLCPLSQKTGAVDHLIIHFALADERLGHQHAHLMVVAFLTAALSLSSLRAATLEVTETCL